MLRPASSCQNGFGEHFGRSDGLDKTRTSERWLSEGRDCGAFNVHNNGIWELRRSVPS